MNPDDQVIICWRVSKAEYVNSEAVRSNCWECKEEIWAAPSSVEVSKKPGWKLICRECVQKIISSGEDVEFRGWITPKNPRPWEKYE